MDQKQRKKAAKQFAENWQGRGYEKGDSQIFWTELLRDVLGMTGISGKCKFEHRTDDGGFVDCWIPDSGVIIEQKSLGIDLDKPAISRFQLKAAIRDSVISFSLTALSRLKVCVVKSTGFASLHASRPPLRGV